MLPVLDTWHCRRLTAAALERRLAVTANLQAIQQVRCMRRHEAGQRRLDSHPRLQVFFQRDLDRTQLPLHLLHGLLREPVRSRTGHGALLSQSAPAPVTAPGLHHVGHERARGGFLVGLEQHVALRVPALSQKTQHLVDGEAPPRALVRQSHRHHHARLALAADQHDELVALLVARKAEVEAELGDLVLAAHGRAVVQVAPLRPHADVAPVPVGNVRQGVRSLLSGAGKSRVHEVLHEATLNLGVHTLGLLRLQDPVRIHCGASNAPPGSYSQLACP